MPKVNLEVFLGPDARVWAKSENVPRTIIDWAEESMSEFEVLEMPLHDRHYAKGAMKAYQPVPVVVPGFLRKPAKGSPAPNVIGNIGEGLGLAAFLCLAGLPPNAVSRIKRRKETMTPAARRTPDFVAAPGTPAIASASIRKLLARHASAGLSKKLAAVSALGTFPGRFPVEAKGTMKASGPALWSGVWQLVEYWHTCIQSGESLSEVGYGVVLCTCGIGNASRSVSIHVFAPSSQVAVKKALADLKSCRGGRLAFEQQFSSAGGMPFVEAPSV